MILYFADRRFRTLGMATTEKIGNWLRVYDDKKTDELKKGGKTFECYIPYSGEDRGVVEAFTMPGNYLLRQQGDEREFYTIIEQESDSSKGAVYLYAEEAGLDLLNEVVLPYQADEAYPISFYIDKFAQDSGFEIGVNEISNLSRKLSWDGESTSVERILSVATQFNNAEIEFSFEEKGLVVVKKYINIYKKRAPNNGVKLRVNKELSSLRVKRSIADLATALYVTGGIPEGSETPITLAGYEYNDGRYYLDGPWLKDIEANKKWSRYASAAETGTGSGHIMATYSYDTTDQSELLNRALSHLKEISHIAVSCEAEVARLPAGVRRGDVVVIVDGDTSWTARIAKIETSISNNSIKATLDDYEQEDENEE